MIEFLIESLAVLNKTSDCISCPCQAHAPVAATRSNIDIPCCAGSLKGGFKTILRHVTSDHHNGTNNDLIGI